MLLGVIEASLEIAKHVNLNVLAVAQKAVKFALMVSFQTLKLLVIDSK